MGAAGLGNLDISASVVSANGKFVAVTGADGFIGSHVVKILLGKGYMVRGTVQDLDPAKVDFLKLLPQADENLSLHKGELLDERCFDDIFRGCDCVFHLASPTLKHQSEMKSPETDMIDQCVKGMHNVLQSCKIAGVKAVVITSSLCVASPKSDRPRMINESHWADHEAQMKKGAYHAASKTQAERAAVQFLAEIPTESAFRLVRICPAFTVGPMLQPTVNSSMELFIDICSGGHHQRMPNDSISMIDVRDTAAHHVAAYEKGVEGRFFSTTEAWHWTLIYKALELYCPHISDWPMPLPRGTKLLPVREYSKTRMNVLGIKERSMLKLLGDAVKELELKKLLLGFSYVKIAGYYDLGSGNGEFLMVYVTRRVNSNGSRITAQFSYVIGRQTEPAVYQLPDGLLSGTGNGDFVLRLNDPDMPILDLNFQIISGGLQMVVKGSIDSIPVTGVCYVTSTPMYANQGSYHAADKSDTVTIIIGPEPNNNLIQFSDGSTVRKFDYDPTKRRFSYTAINSNGVNFEHRLYMNVGTCGLYINYVQFDPNDPKNTGSSKVYTMASIINDTPEGPKIGAASLATFAGYYYLGDNSSTGAYFVSIEENGVFVCTDGINCTLYTSFTFQDNKLTFPFPDAPSITFDGCDSVNVVLPDGSSVVISNDFSLAPLKAFGYKTLSTSRNSTVIASLRITPSPEDGQSRLLLIKDGSPIFDTTEYQYNPLEQSVEIDNFKLYFCYNPEKGVTCGVTNPTSGFNFGLYAYP